MLNVTVARSNRGRYHVSDMDTFTPLCGATALQRITTVGGSADIAPRIFEEFDKLSSTIRCEKCWEKALRVAYGREKV